MDLRDQLLESSDRKQAGAGKFSIASIAVHGVIVGAIIFVGATATHRIDAEDKPIRAFVATAAAPPPPPPPPPPSGSSAPQTATPKPVVVHETPKFVQPTETPKDVPQVVPTTSTVTNLAPSTEPTAPSGDAGGVPGGVEGGVKGGVDGGVVGGQIGGVVGGQLGGVIGGTPGGTVGGTGSGEAKAEPAPEPKQDTPLRVGGDVKAPTVLSRAEPQYTDLARKAHVTGVVIVEAIIDKDGRVDQVKVLKGLPMGLSEAAEEAVKKWKFKPGTLNGEPVDVIFNLTVNFTLQ